MKSGIIYFTTCFHGFGILRHVDPFVRMLHILHSVTDDLHNFNVKLENDYSLEATTDSINDYSTNLLDMVELLQTTNVNLKNIQYSTLVILIEMVSKTVEAHSDDCSFIYDGKTGIINNPMKHAESLDNIFKKTAKWQLRLGEPSEKIFEFLKDSKIKRQNAISLLVLFTYYSP